MMTVQILSLLVENCTMLLKSTYLPQTTHKYTCKKHPSNPDQRASRALSWSKKTMIKGLFALAIIWGVLTIIFLQSNLVNYSDNFRFKSFIPIKEEKIYPPRLIYLGTTEEFIEHTNQMQQKTPQREIYYESLTKRSYIANDKYYKEVNFRNKMFDEECVAMGSWQESSFPNCNQIHEMGLLVKATTDEFHYVASGGWNDVFKVLDDNSSGLDPALAMKKLCPKKGNKYLSRRYYGFNNYERVRQDAIILERLSSSNYVMDILGYCGATIIGPFAEGGNLSPNDIASLSLKGGQASKERLKLMVDAAKGLAGIHGDVIPSIVHGDLTNRQYMLVNGTLQLGDFNQAILIKRNSTSPDKACTFHGCWGS